LGDQENIPEIIDSFSKMQNKYNLSQGFMEKLKKAGFKRPTPV
jgi:superfamily II DNA/RNA helicase